MLAYLVAAVIALVSCLLAWAIGLFGIIPVSFLLLTRLVVLLIGFVAAGVAAWWLRKRAAARDATPENTALDQLLQQAEAKLAASRRTSKGGLRSLPLVYVLGEANSAKTTVVNRSGLEPELLAGEVYRDRDIVPTQLANLWFTQQAVLLEAGSAFAQDQQLWRQLLQRTRPSAYGTAFGSGSAPFRAAVVCIPCDQLLGASSSEAVRANATALSARLRTMAGELGSPVPVYVLFTKLDRVPGFAEFVRNLSTEEAGSLLGSGLTMPAPGDNYPEAAHAATAASFDALIYGLAGTRIELLQRENDPTQLAGAYQFPRELRKFREYLSIFLAELGRPSHLQTNPQLRGFYFTGVRAVVQEQPAFSPVLPKASALPQADATGIFASRPPQAVAPTPAGRAPEKVAQWTFLPRFFPQAVLGDVAVIPAGRNNQATAVRRWIYGGLACLLLVYLLLLSVSWARNAALEHAIEDNATASATPAGDPGDLAGTGQLAHLDQLRATLQQLEAFQRNGPPLSYRWGLYHGNDLLAIARQDYFHNFQALLLNRSEHNLLAAMNALPAVAGTAPPPNADYNHMYAALRAYLITVAYPQKSTSDFLAPVVESFWESPAGTPNPSVSSEQRQLARRQMDFYADQLRLANPFHLAPADPTIEHTRKYLASFGGLDRIYGTMLAAAEKGQEAVDFNKQHPGSAQTVLDPHIVPAAFTRTGFTSMQDELAHPERYFQGEEWVLGNQAPPSIDQSNLRQKLQARYTDDFLTQWRAFIREASVVHYRDLQDAGEKLNVLSGNASPLLALFATVSSNTDVPDPAISNAFQPSQVLVPGNARDAYIGPGNKSYMDALLNLNGALHQTAGVPGGAPDAAAAAPVAAAAGAARIAAQQTAQSFHMDQQAHVDSLSLALLLAPITATDTLLHGMGPAAANANGKNFCSSFSGVFARFPFTASSSVQATPEEVTKLLQPGTGALAEFYNTSLKTLLVPQNGIYVPAPNAPTQVTPAFLRFFNRVSGLSQTLFPNGATAPTLTFTLRPLPSSGIQSSSFKVDSQTLTNTDGPKQFTWSAATAQSAGLVANSLPLSFEGPWAVFQLLGKAHSQKAGTAYDISFPLEVANTPVKAADGTPIVARYELSGPGADVLAPGSLAGLRCVAEIAAK